MTIPARVAEILNFAGTAATYRRMGSAAMDATTLKMTPSYTSTPVMVSVRGYSAKELVGTIQQGDREVKLAAASIAFTPRQGDKVVLPDAECTIQSVEIRYAMGDTALYVLQVRG